MDCLNIRITIFTIKISTKPLNINKQQNINFIKHSKTKPKVETKTLKTIITKSTIITTITIYTFLFDDYFVGADWCGMW